MSRFYQEVPIFGKDFLQPCALHGDDEGWWRGDEADAVPYCPDCGEMLNTESCIWCGANWIAFGSSRDDLMADATLNDMGDLCCAACYEENEDWNEDDSLDYDWEYYEGEKLGPVIEAKPAATIQGKAESAT
jgi:hypothetical protein